MAASTPKSGRKMEPATSEQESILTREEAKSDPAYGCAPEQRPIGELLEYAIVALDKPCGPSSHQVSSYVARILGASRTGHSGTLDPGVSGVLPVAIGRATRIVHSLLSAGKEYVCLLRLHHEVDDAALHDALRRFTGTITQMPPVRSAVKRRARERSIYTLDLIERDGPYVLIRADVEAGTYIRKLVHDLGEHLGCGAHMHELRRIRAGPFAERDGLATLQDLTDAYHYYNKDGDERELRRVLEPPERGVAHLSKLWLLDEAVAPLCHGAAIKASGISRLSQGIRKDEIVAALTLKGELIATAKARMPSDAMLNATGVAAAPDQVFMKVGTYTKR